METAKNLKQAYSIIAKVRDSLNHVKTTCACCGLVKYENSTEWHNREILNSTLTKIEKVINSLQS